MLENKPSRADLLIAVLIGLAMLSLLAPLGRPRAVSESPWLVEFVSTAVFAGIFAFHAIRDKGFVGRLFALGDPATRWIVRLLAAFALWSLLSAAWARSPYLSVHHALLWGEYILVFLYFRERLSAAHDYRLISFTFALVATLLGVLAIIEYATLPDFKVMEGVIRLRYGAYSELLVTILPVLAALGLMQRPAREQGRNTQAGVPDTTVVYARASALLPAAAVLGWVTVMLSLSKGAFIAGIVGFGITFACIILFAAQYRRRAVVSFAVWLALTIIVQAGFSVLSPIPATVGYISGKADATRGTALARVFVWKIGKRMATEHPFVGVGSDNFVISMVSSFSFRLAQNGIAFFIVFALAAVELKRLRGEQTHDDLGATPRTTFAGVILPVYFLLSLVTLGSKGYAERCVLNAGREPDIEKASASYERAVRLDPVYASAYLQRSGRYYAAEDFAQAAIDLQRAINGGSGVVITYSALAASFE